MSETFSIRPTDSFATLYRRWFDTGCSVRAAAALANAGISEASQIAEKGRAYFRQRRNCGPTTVAHIGKLIGGWPPTPRKSAREAIAAALLLSLPADQHDEALDVAGDAISAMYRSGFVIVLSAREERRVQATDRADPGAAVGGAESPSTA
jgi:hypothetical protein